MGKFWLGSDVSNDACVDAVLCAVTARGRRGHDSSTWCAISISNVEIVRSVMLRVLYMSAHVNVAKVLINHTIMHMSNALDHAS